jgi:hypothetical protein
LQGQALARAAAKSREQSSQQDISWDVDGFSVTAPGQTEQDKINSADTEEALNDAAEVEKLLTRLKNASVASTYNVVEEQDIVEEIEEEKTEKQLQNEPEEEDEKEDEKVFTLKAAGNKQNKKSLAKKKAASKTPSQQPLLLSPFIDTAPTPAPASVPAPTAPADTGGSSFHALIPQLEARLQALQSKIASMEESRVNLAAMKAKFEEELRECRITVELVTAERQKMSKQVDEQKKKLAAAEKLTKERDIALKAEKLRVSELADRVVESKTASSKEQEIMTTRWEAKITTLTSEVQNLKTELENALQATTEAKTAQKLAETARIEAEQKESAAEQRAIAAINEAAQLRATSSQVKDKSEELIRDNERRSKTFNAAVEAQIQRFKKVLEEERDAALARIEEANKENINLQHRVVEITAVLQKTKETGEEHAAAVMVEKRRVEEYEHVVATMQGQVAAAIKAADSAEAELRSQQAQWGQESKSLKNKLETLETELEVTKIKAQKTEIVVSTVRAEAEQWRAAAQQYKVSQAVAAAAQEQAETATAEATALKIQIAHLQREIDERNTVLRDAEGGSDFGTGVSTPPGNMTTTGTVATAAPGTTSKAKNESKLPGSRQIRRESSSNGLSGFDLESLRRTPLLSGYNKTGMEQRRSSSLFFGSTRQVLWLYMALVHVLLLVAMGRASHAHLACAHMHLNDEGGLP